MRAPRSRWRHRRASAGLEMLPINTRCKSSTALTYCSCGKITTNFSKNANSFLMSPIRKIECFTPSGAVAFHCREPTIKEHIADEATFPTIIRNLRRRDAAVCCFEHSQRPIGVRPGYLSFKQREYREIGAG